MADGRNPAGRKRHPQPGSGSGAVDSVPHRPARAETVTPEALGECRRQVAAVDQAIISAKDLPELAHPDAEMLDLLGRYLEARSRVLALA
ncbi:hypothetical protein [Rhodococcus sp. A14]|uniref:hypothetical protein n=1 Tax=Rhodococcus sp. A14 TaxID=1194106 RepID=UPI001F0E011A